jgi:hypothetical protein
LIADPDRFVKDRLFVENPGGHFSIPDGASCVSFGLGTAKSILSSSRLAHKAD